MVTTVMVDVRRQSLFIKGGRTVHLEVRLTLSYIVIAGKMSKGGGSAANNVLLLKKSEDKGRLQ